VNDAAAAPTFDERTSRRNHWIGIGLAAFGAIAFSGKAIVIKLAYRYGVDAVTLLALRMLVALPFFLSMAVWAGSRSRVRIVRDDALRILALGFFGYYLASFLDFAGLAYLTATLERLILYLTPTLVLAIGFFLHRRAVSRRQMFALIVSYAGVLLAFAHDRALGGSNVALGGMLVLASALSYAIYLVGSGQLVARVGAVRLTAYASSVACVLCLLQFAVLRPWSALQLPTPVWWLSLLNGSLCTVVPVLAVMLAIDRIGSGLAAQVGMLGPVSTIVLSLLVLGEAMGPWQIAGTVLVMGGVFVLAKK